MSLTHFKKQLRTNQTDAENILWYFLRANRFNSFKFKRQVPINPYIVDFICYEKRLIIELDGGQHNAEAARQHDTVRTEFLESEGFQVLRFWNHEIFESRDVVLDKIWSILSNPSPCGTSATDLSRKGRGEKKLTSSLAEELVSVGDRRGEKKIHLSPCGRGLGIVDSEGEG